MKELKGIIIAMATPMRADESLDTGRIKALVDRLIADGADGIFASGTMGECPYLLMEEKLALAKATIAAVAGRVPVIIGTGAPTTREVAGLNSRLADSGADAVSVVLPYYFRLTQEEIYAHFAKILEKSPLPVMAYNIPHFTGTHMEAATAAKLWKENGLVGIKDSSGDFDTLKSYIDVADRSFSVIVGADEWICGGLEAGARGAISAPANVLTHVCRQIYARYTADDIAGAQAAQADWNRVTGLIKGIGTFPGTVKAAMARLALPVGNARMPILPADDARLEQVLPELMEIGEKYRA